MSTQRRENRWQRNNCTDSAGYSDQKLATPIARNAGAFATVGTAPPIVSARLATNSLQSDHRTTQLLDREFHLGSPPLPAGNRAAFGTPATSRSPHPLIPSSSAFESILTA